MQSSVPSQKRSLGRQEASAHPSIPVPQPAASSKGFGGRGSAASTSQSVTLARKSQICRVTSNNSPSEQRNSKTSSSIRQKQIYISLGISHLYSSWHGAKSHFILGFISDLESIAGVSCCHSLTGVDAIIIEVFHYQSNSHCVDVKKWNACLRLHVNGSTTPCIATLKNEQSAFA